jgi:hypothetical protein
MIKKNEFKIFEIDFINQKKIFMIFDVDILGGVYLN